jgi:hypothetical protein
MTLEPPTSCHDPAAAGASEPARDPLVGDQQLQVLLALAEGLEGDPAALLDLLRRLEQLHRTIQDGAFRNSLPGDRNRLFQLLESIEDSGGWPYIPRLQLRTFMDLLQRGAPQETVPAGQQRLAA